MKRLKAWTGLKRRSEPVTDKERLSAGITIYPEDTLVFVEQDELLPKDLKWGDKVLIEHDSVCEIGVVSKEGQVLDKVGRILR